MLREHYLYRHIRNDINKPFYIGIGTKPNKFNGFKTEYKRAFDCSSKKRNPFWINVYNKSRKNITIEILYESNSYIEIKEKEIEFINLYGRNDSDKGILTNLTDGGEGVSGKIVSEKTKKLLSTKIKGRKLPQETIDKIILNHASKQPGYRKQITQEQRDKISKTLTGRYFKEDVMCIETGIIYSSIKEMCNQMFNGKGHEKVIQCLSDKYVNKSYRGFHFTKNMSDITIKYPSYFKKTMCIDNMTEYKTITECAISLFGSKKHKRGISKAIKSNKSYKNFTFKFI